MKKCLAICFLLLLLCVKSAFVRASATPGSPQRALATQKPLADRTFPEGGDNYRCL
ncbi:hypothetical protein [Puia dinghuensis]|uniref:hypothetical protein n=1 Tax=Puia dinghuensis TaxID=1792502 RepID=UPI00166E8848|nr:hypothetical protein [Puia dinghuensis]